MKSFDPLPSPLATSGGRVRTGSGFGAILCATLRRESIYTPAQIYVMSKVKTPKTKGVPNKHLHARAAFLYQAATYLTLRTTRAQPESEQHPRLNEPSASRLSPLALKLGSDLQQVSRKGQIRLSVGLKRSVCKRCNSILIPGRTATQEVENPSKGGKKPWADVLVVQCKTCDGRKVFPICPKNQPRKIRQQLGTRAVTSHTVLEDIQQSDSIARASTDQGSTTT